MQGPHARRVYPSFDEPIFKATFKVFISYQLDYSWTSSSHEYFALSNMPMIEVRLFENLASSWVGSPLLGWSGIF
jgi:aminopeptidase N